MARLGDLLVRENIISAEQLQLGQEAAVREGGRLGTTLVKMKVLTDDKLTKFLAKHYHVPAVNLSEVTLDPEILRLVSLEMVLKHQLVPINRTGTSLTVAMADPSNIFAIDDVKFSTGLHIDVAVTSETQIASVVDKFYKKSAAAAYDEVMSGFNADEITASFEEQSAGAVDITASAEEAPVIKLVNLILVDAIKKRASDIHVEPYEKSFRVRFRIDGALSEAMSPPLKLRNSITSRIKIMAALDISERRLPQDGRIKLKLGGDREMDFRVSVLPTLFGEKIVMRLLDKGNLQLDMTKLGFEEQSLKMFKAGIHKPFGMVLVTGPTGSGKTTTLYSAMSELNQISENISTAEDPVEFNLAGVNQVQMHEDIGLNFAAALRSFLRQDPDIIMVGEIRDLETCEIGIKAALTGHLVLSTLHTNDAPSTITRMMNMGIEPFLLAAALNVIVAQRLIRKVCEQCKAPVPSPTPEVLRELQVPEDRIGKFTMMRGKGCEICGGTGLKGRIAIYEVLTASETVKEAILRGANATEVKQSAIRGGMKTLRQAGISKLLEGLTTIEEIGRVTPAD